MEANVNQYQEIRNESVTKVSFFKRMTAFYQDLKEMLSIKSLISLLNLIMTFIIFTSGVHKMIEEVAASFPIHPLFHVPVGFILMAIVVRATHAVTKLSVELLFNWSEFKLSYKIILPITNVLLLFFCWSVQSEGGEIQVTEIIDAEIEQVDSQKEFPSLQKLDEDASLVRFEINKSDSIMQSLDHVRESRKGKWLNEKESSIYLSAQTAKQQLTNQLAQFSQNRLDESQRLDALKQQQLKRLREKRDRLINKGKNKAGLAEIILVLSSIFIIAYKDRYATPIINTQVVEKEETKEEKEVKPFPKGLPLEEREEMVKEFKPLRYTPEEKHLFIRYRSEQYYIEIDKYIASMRTCKNKLENPRSRSPTIENKVRNLSYYEHVLSLTGLNLEEISKDFGYSPMNLDYWNTTTDTDMGSGIKPLNNRYISLNTA